MEIVITIAVLAITGLLSWPLMLKTGKNLEEIRSIKLQIAVTKQRIELMEQAIQAKKERIRMEQDILANMHLAHSKSTAKKVTSPKKSKKS